MRAIKLLDLWEQGTALGPVERALALAGAAGAETDDLRGLPYGRTNAGVLAYNQVAGEPIAHLGEGRPLVVRTPESDLTLANLMRAQIYGVFATLSLGMRALHDEDVVIDRIQAHGGLFRTAGVAQCFLAAALDARVGVAESAGEGGAWGIAVLASFTAAGGGDLTAFLEREVFASVDMNVVDPDPADAAGFAAYLRTSETGLEIQRRAVVALPAAAVAHAALPAAAVTHAALGVHS